MHRSRGFTLIELVTTATIFAILGAMLFSMVKSGMDMWTRGEAQRDEIEKSTVVLETIAGGLRSAFTENDPMGERAEVRFYSDFVDYDCDRDGERETRLQRLAFVRINVEERENLEMRVAGDLPLGRRYFTLSEAEIDLLYRRNQEEETYRSSGDELDEMDVYRPTGGLAECLFTAFPSTLTRDGKMSGTMSLFRGYRSPIGGEDSFFAPGALRDPFDVAAQLVPVMGGVLHIEFRFFDQDSFTFDQREAQPGTKGGAGYVWDSTRGVLFPEGDEEGKNAFRLASTSGTLDSTEGSEDDPSDDIYPSRVKIVVVINAGGGQDGLARLTRTIGPNTSRIPVDIVLPFREWRFGEKYVRLGAEWIRFSRLDGNELVVDERGVRNTIPSDHKKGRPIFAGRAFSAEVSIPARREWWNRDD